MSQIVVYKDPNKDLDEQDQEIRRRHPDAEWVEVHVGGLKAAQLSAEMLGVPLVEAYPEEEAAPSKPKYVKRRKQTQERYEALRPYFRQAELLGITSLRGVAEYLNENKVPLPSGQDGEWKAVQVKRARAWL